MPVPAQRDLEDTRSRLASWLAGRPGAPGGPISVGELSIPAGAGFSNETLVADSSWPGKLVVRLRPTGFQLFMDADFDLQFRLLQTLGAETPVPVPEALWYEPDPDVLGAPFFVMRHVDGRSITDQPNYNAAGWLAEATVAEREQVWSNAVDALITVHRVPTAAVSFLAKPELGPTGFDQVLRYWERSFAWAARGRPQPVAEAAWEWMSAHPPAVRETALSWGDARMGNMLWRGCEVAAVLDWEMLSLGGPEMDLGWWLFLDDFHAFTDPRLPGLGSRADTIARWSAGTGRTPRDLEFYEIFAGFRFAVVMIRMAQMFRSWGVERANLGDMEINNGVTHVLAGKLGLAPPGALP